MLAGAEIPPRARAQRTNQAGIAHDVSVFSCHDITSRCQQVPRQNLLTFSISTWVTRKDRRLISRYIPVATSDTCLSQRLGRKIGPRGLSLRTRTDHHMTVVAAGARDLLRT